MKVKQVYTAADKAEPKSGSKSGVLFPCLSVHGPKKIAKKMGKNNSMRFLYNEY